MLLYLSEGQGADITAFHWSKPNWLSFKRFAGSSGLIPQARAELITKSPDEVLRGIVASYGKVKGAPALIAFIGDIDDTYVNEKIGYTGEGIILEATAMGLGTCWVGGSMFFRRGLAESIVGAGAKEKSFCSNSRGPCRKKLLSGRKSDDWLRAGTPP